MIGVNAETKNQQKEILFKKIAFYDQNKYLVIIYFVERQINQIEKGLNDKLFFEYETVYCVQASCMTEKRDVIQWEITPDEAILITEQTYKPKIAKEIINNIHISEK